MTKSTWIAAILAGWLACATAQAGTRHYYYTDPQGTVLAKADASGNIIETSDYRPYGAQALGTPKDGPGYTGHVNDPGTGLVYMQARYYDPEVGRFLSVDPVGVAAGNGFNFNRFAYVANNPLIGVDPDGRQTRHIGAGDSDEEKRRARQERDRQRSAGGDDSDHVAKSVIDRVAKMAAKGLIKKYSPGAVKPWIGVLSRSITAAKKAKNWGDVAASINDITLKSALKDIQFYKDAGIVPPTGRIYYFSVIPWGQNDWSIYDNRNLTLPAGQVWENFIHDTPPGESDASN